MKSWGTHGTHGIQGSNLEMDLEMDLEAAFGDDRDSTARCKPCTIYYTQRGYLPRQASFVQNGIGALIDRSIGLG